MKIAIDMDKTIFSCKSCLYDVLNKFFSRVPRSGRGFVVLDRKRVEKPSRLARLSRLFRWQSFYEIENCVEIINSWYRQGIEVLLLSARPNIKAMRNLTRQWLEEHNVECDEVVIACADKLGFCEARGVQLLIENNYRLCQKAAEYGLKSVHFDPMFAQNGQEAGCDWQDIARIVQSEAEPDENFAPKT